MKLDGIELLGSSTATNLAIVSGVTFPANATNGELFFKTGVGLHIYDGIAWIQVGAGTELTAQSITAALGFTPAALENGKIAITQIPSLTITDTFVVSTQAAMLGLTAEVGDVAVRTDTNTTYILRTANPTVLANWVQLLNPTSDVTSVNGLTGTVVLTSTVVDEGTNLYYTNARARSSISVTGDGGSYNPTTGVITIAAASSSNFTLANGSGGNNQVQYNANGILTGSAKFTWVDASGTLTLGGSGSSGNLVLGQAGTPGNITTTNSGLQGADLTLTAGNSTFQATTAPGNVIIKAGASTEPGGTAGYIRLATTPSDAGGYLDRLVITRVGEWKVGGLSGTSGQVLTSNGTGVAPTWTAIPAATVPTSFTANTITAQNDGNTGLDLTLTAGNSTFQGTMAGGSVVIRAGSSPEQGGTTGFIRLATSPSLGSYADRLVITRVGEWKVNGVTGTSGQVLTSAGAGSTPTWTTVAAAAAGTLTGTILAANVVTASLTTIRPADINLDSTTAPALTIQGGANTSTGFGVIGGTVNILGGATSGAQTGATGGTVNIAAATGGTGGTGGNIVLNAGGGTTPGHIRMFTGGAERFRITNTGAISVGATTTATGTTGQVLTSAGSGAPPTWATAAGGVSSVSVTTANGISGTVATATTTPAITLTLGDITPNYVTTTGENIAAAASTYRSLFFSTSSVANGGRWIMGADNAAESSTTGSNFFLTRQYNDGVQNIVLTVSRANGVVDFKATPTVNGTVIGSTAAAGSLTGTIIAANVVQASLSTIYSPSTTFKTTAEAAGTIILGGNSGPGGLIRGFDGGTGPGTITVRPGDIAFSSTTGGTLALTGGANTSVGAGAHGGPVNITGGAGSGGNGGNVTFAGAAGSTAGNGGNATVIGGTATGANTGGNVSLGGGQGATLANSGAIRFVTGTSASYLERFRVTGSGGLAFGNNAANVGTAGQVLTSAGDAPPTWSAAPASAAGTLTGATLAAGVTASSLTSVGTLFGLNVVGNVTFSNNANGALGENLKLTNAFVSANSNVALSFVAGDQTSNPTSQILGVSKTVDTSSIAGDIAFLTKTAGVTGVGLAERMRVTSIGNLLIGATTDDATNKLQVTGSVVATGLATSGSLQTGRALHRVRIVDNAGTDYGNDIFVPFDGGSSTLKAFRIRSSYNGAVGGGALTIAGSSNTGTQGSDPALLTYVNRLSIEATGQVTMGGSLSAQALSLPFANTGIEMGAPGTASTPFIDFRSSGNSGVDYDVRLIAQGGTASTGLGALTIAAATVTATGAFTAASISESSTIRIKENVRQLTGGLESVLAMRGVVYDLIDGSAMNQIGLIAEEVKEVLPALVAHNGDGEVSGVHYARMVAVLIEGMKAQEQRIKSLEAMVQELKNG